METENGAGELEPVEMPVLLEPRTRGELDVQIVTAKRFPRKISAFKEQALDMATLDEETASGCFYSLPRGGKPVEGPSVRLAEIVLSAWGNVRSEAKVVEVGEKEITAEATTWDLEKNVAVRFQVKRRITDKNGKRYTDDMVVVTGNAACSIALRNSVFKVIPMAYTKAVYQAARQVAIGDAKTLAAKRAEMVAYFGKMGVKPERVFGVVGCKNLEDIGLDELATLKGLATAIKEGDTNVDEAFPVDGSRNQPEKGKLDLKNMKPGKLENHDNHLSNKEQTATKRDGPRPQGEGPEDSSVEDAIKFINEAPNDLFEDMGNRWLIENMKGKPQDAQNTISKLWNNRHQKILKERREQESQITKEEV